MARVVDDARQVARAAQGNGVCISVFLDLDPSRRPTSAALAPQIGSVVDEARRGVERLEPSLDHDSITAARTLVRRIAEYLDEDLDRSRRRGAALYASTRGDTWRDLRLPSPVDHTAVVGSFFLLSPLLRSIERDRELVLVALNRERGTIWHKANGSLSVVDDHTEQIRRRHDQGGWSQANFQRSIDRDAEAHIQRVADALRTAIEPGSPALVVVSSPVEDRPIFERHLAPHVRQALIGWATVEAHDNGNALVEEAEELLAARLGAERRELAARWEEASGTGGPASGGWEPLMADASAGAVETLLVDGSTRDASECPACGRGSLTSGPCAVDGTPLEPAPGGALDVCLRATLTHGGDVRLLDDGTLPAAAGGAAALLRFPSPERR
jgi:peptide chain release factor subunit 1